MAIRPRPRPVRACARNRSTRRRRERRSMSPREYEARVDLCRLWDLMQMRLPSVEIGRRMSKDPAWVCRSIQKIESDFTTLFPRPNEERTIATNIATLESLHARLLREAEDLEGSAKVAALRAAAEVWRQKCDYEIRTGQVAERQKNTSIFPCFDDNPIANDPLVALGAMAFKQRMNDRAPHDESPPFSFPH